MAAIVAARAAMVGMGTSVVALVEMEAPVAPVAQALLVPAEVHIRR